MGWASRRPLYFSHVVHIANLSPGLFKMYSANCWFLMTLNLDKEMGPQPAMRPTSLICSSILCLWATPFEQLSPLTTSPRLVGHCIGQWHYDRGECGGGL